MEAKSHWQGIYANKNHKEVSWYTDHINSSLAWIDALQLNKDAAIADMGGGASTLVDDLLARGYARVSVLDLSPEALAIARHRLGDSGASVSWLEGSVLEEVFATASLDLWHDRAVFHFLTAEADRVSYRDRAMQAIKPGGYLLMSVFAEDGPEKCSGLVIRRHHESELHDFFSPAFDKIKGGKMIHATPSGSNQRFVTLLMRRKS